MCLSLVASGCCVAPSIIGTFGPYTSASIRPTLWPSFTRARARLTATVVLPTPPLPLATATRFFTPGIGWRSGICCAAGPGGICLPILSAEIEERFLASPACGGQAQNDEFYQWCVALGVQAVTLLVFFPGAARTRIVAPNFCSGANWLWRFGLIGTRLKSHFFFLALLLAFPFTRKCWKLRRRFVCDPCGGASCGGKRTRRPRTSRYWLPRTTATLRRRTTRPRRVAFHLYLHIVEITNGFVIDARHHVFKQDERFFLEFNERIFLPVAAQADAFLQVIERQQVVFPLAIHNIQNDAAFEPAHQVRRKLLFFVFVFLGDGFSDGIGKLIVIQRGGIRIGRFGINAEFAVHFSQELRGVPLAGMQLTPAVSIHKLARNIFRDANHVVALVLALERRAANPINRFALLVHYVVVFQQVFARIEVLRFDGFLRGLNTTRD